MRPSPSLMISPMGPFYSSKHRDMILGREFEDKCAEMYYRGKMFGFVHLYSGQEAVSTGKGAYLIAFIHCTMHSTVLE